MCANLSKNENKIRGEGGGIHCYVNAITEKAQRSALRYIEMSASVSMGMCVGMWSLNAGTQIRWADINILWV